MKNLESKINNEPEINHSEFKPSPIVRGLSWLVSKFPSKKVLNEKRNIHSSVWYYGHLALDYSIGALIKAQVGALPHDMLTNMAYDLKNRYNIEETPETYAKYSLVLGALNATMFLGLSYGLIKQEWLPFLKPAGEIKLWLTWYTIKLELPARAIMLAVMKKQVGIFPAEISYAYYKPGTASYIEPPIRKAFDITKEKIKQTRIFKYLQKKIITRK